MLNDCSGAILARNILFLYLCMLMPKGDVSQNEWIASMWSLWYNHELLPRHDAMLSSALAQLIQWSYTWQEWSECPLGCVVQYSSPATFATVKKFWELWHTRAMTKSVNDMKAVRSTFQYNHLNRIFGDCSSREVGLRALALNDFTFFTLRNCSFLYSSEKQTIM